METIFTVKNEHLARLNPQEAVEFFRDLLWAEAKRTGIPISKINVSNWINVPDGGIDALVEEHSASSKGGFIKAGRSSYQIKAGASFEPWKNSEIRNELFGRKKPPNKVNLGTSIRDCLDKDGTYVLVCFKQDLTDEPHRQTVEALDHYFRDCGYKDPKVEVWSQNRLIGFLEIFPSLALKVNERGALRFQTHQSWSQEAEMRREFRPGQAQKDFMESMRDTLRKNGQEIHIRVWGEPGIGKTRLVLEATRTEDLQPLVIYCDAAGRFRDSDLMNEILKDDNQFTAILVLDECDPDSRSYIWNKLQYCSPRIKLVTIYNDYDETSGNINYLNAPPLSEDRIRDVIQGYGNPKDQAARWSEFCGGSPRVAHVLGQNLKNNPEDLLKSPDTVNIWDRFIVGGDDPNGQQVRQRRLLLQHIALFKRLGYGGPVVGEAQAVAKMVAKVDTNLTWPRFQEIIQDLRARRILQGETTLYITPKAFHIRLWVDWWNSYGETFSFEEFVQDLPEPLYEWFCDMFRYAEGSKAARRVAEELLGPNGLFEDDS